MKGHQCFEHQTSEFLLKSNDLLKIVSFAAKYTVEEPVEGFREAKWILPGAAAKAIILKVLYSSHGVALVVSSKRLLFVLFSSTNLLVVMAYLRIEADALVCDAVASEFRSIIDCCPWKPTDQRRTTKRARVESDVASEPTETMPMLRNMRDTNMEHEYVPVCSICPFVLSLVRLQCI